MIESIDLSSYSIEQLNALVDQAKRAIADKERNRVQQVRNQMQVLASSVGMSIHDMLILDGKKKKVSATVGKIKFRNPANPEQTWTGRGKRPRWLQQALDQGAKLQDFLIA